MTGDPSGHEAIVWFAVVVLFTRQPQRGSVTPWLVAIVAVALIAFVVSKVVERPLGCETDVTLATSFRLTAQAPTRAALQRDQDALSASGCTRSLVAALRQARSS